MQYHFTPSVLYMYLTPCAVELTLRTFAVAGSLNMSFSSNVLGHDLKPNQKKNQWSQGTFKMLTNVWQAAISWNDSPTCWNSYTVLFSMCLPLYDYKQWNGKSLDYTTIMSWTFHYLLHTCTLKLEVMMESMGIAQLNLLDSLALFQQFLDQVFYILILIKVASVELLLLPVRCNFGDSSKHKRVSKVEIFQPHRA